MIVFTKRPDEVLDYDALFAKWLPSGDTISGGPSPPAPVVVLTPSTTTLTVTEVQVVSGTTVKVWMAAGLDGDDVDVRVTATTLAGRVKDHCFRIRVKDC
jgi:hypothetical protein